MANLNRVYLVMIAATMVTAISCSTVSTNTGTSYIPDKSDLYGAFNSTKKVCKNMNESVRILNGKRIHIDDRRVVACIPDQVRVDFHHFFFCGDEKYFHLVGADILFEDLE